MPQVTQAAGAAAPQDETRAARMQWWREGRFGMFVHWGLYSLIGHEAWALENEGIPLAEYEKLARHFQPRPNAGLAEISHEGLRPQWPRYQAGIAPS